MLLPRYLSAIILLALGAGVLAVAYRGYCAGELPAGANFLKAYRPNRQENTLAFYFFLILYFISGLVLAVWGLLAAIGMAPPLALN